MAHNMPPSVNCSLDDIDLSALKVSALSMENYVKSDALHRSDATSALLSVFYLRFPSRKHTRRDDSHPSRSVCLRVQSVSDVHESGASLTNSTWL